MQSRVCKTQLPKTGRKLLIPSATQTHTLNHHRVFWGGILLNSHTVLQPAGVAPGKATQNTPQNKGLTLGSKAGCDLLGQQHFCNNRERDCAEAPGRQTCSTTECCHTGDLREVTSKQTLERCSRFWGTQRADTESRDQRETSGDPRQVKPEQRPEG